MSRSLKSKITKCDENLIKIYQLVENNSRIFVDVVRVSVSVIRLKKSELISRNDIPCFDKGRRDVWRNTAERNARLNARINTRLYAWGTVVVCLGVFADTAATAIELLHA